MAPSDHFVEQPTQILKFAQFFVGWATSGQSSRFPAQVNSPGLIIPPRRVPPVDTDKLREQISEANVQVTTLEEQIHQSESNLAAQKEVTETQIKDCVGEAIQSAKREHLELLAGDTSMDLEEMDTGLLACTMGI